MQKYIQCTMQICLFSLSRQFIFLFLSLKNDTITFCCGLFTYIARQMHIFKMNFGPQTILLKNMKLYQITNDIHININFMLYTHILETYMYTVLVNLIQHVCIQKKIFFHNKTNKNIRLRYKSTNKTSDHSFNLFYQFYLLDSVLVLEYVIWCQVQIAKFLFTYPHLLLHDSIVIG